MTITLDKIPSDLEEMIEEEEHVHGNYSREFKDVMFFHDLMENGTYSRSHILMTEKCLELGLEGTLDLITGTNQEERKKIIEEENKKREIKQMYKIAKKYNYVITSNGE